MGFLTLISLTPPPSASWDFLSRKLTLNVEGQILVGTHSINLQMDRFDPQQFYLEAWVPESGIWKPYKHKQQFENYNKPDQITIHALNGDFTVPVFIIQSPPGHGDVETQATLLSPGSNIQSLIPAVPQTTKLPQTEHVKVAHDIYAFIGFPFDIRQAVQVPRGGEIDINFDSRSLILEKAGVKDIDLYWRFNPIQSGKTQVKVTVYGGETPYVMDIVYNVNVLFVDSTSSTNISALGVNDVTIPENRWLFRVRTAIQHVLREYPEAKLYSVHARAPNHMGVDSTWELTEMVCNFFLPKDHSQIFIMSTGIDTWKRPIHIHTPVLGAKELPLPNDLDGEQAIELLRKRGFEGKFIQLAMEWSGLIHSGGSQKVYKFEMEDGCKHEITYNDVEDPKGPAPAPVDAAQPAADAGNTAPSQIAAGIAAPQATIDPVIPAPPPLVGVAA